MKRDDIPDNVEIMTTSPTLSEAEATALDLEMLRYKQRYGYFLDGQRAAMKDQLRALSTQARPWA